MATGIFNDRFKSVLKMLDVTGVIIMSPAEMMWALRSRETYKEDVKRGSNSWKKSFPSPASIVWRQGRWLVRARNSRWTLSMKNIDLHYRSELWDHLFFDDCLNYLNFNSVSDKICTLSNVKAIKIIIKISLEWSRFVQFWRNYCKKSQNFNGFLNFK